MTRRVRFVHGLTINAIRKDRQEGWTVEAISRMRKVSVKSIREILNPRKHFEDLPYMEDTDKRSVEEIQADLDAWCNKSITPGYSGKFSTTRTVGVRHGRAKLTEEDIPIIRKLSETWLQWKIAALFNVTTNVISQIKTGRAWRHNRRIATFSEVETFLADRGSP